MDTLRTIWYDVKRILKQSKDDLEIPDAQGMYWTLVIADRLRMQHIVKRRSGAFLTTFVLDVQPDTTWTNRRFVLLPKSIYDLDLDAGIQSLSYFASDSDTPEFRRIELFRTDPSRSRSRNMSVYQAATEMHPYFWREGSRLYLDGVNPDLEKIEAKLLTTLPTIQEVDVEGLADVALDFPRELVYPLSMALMDQGRFTLALPGQHLVNDGTNRNVNQVAGSPEKRTSVNAPLVATGDAN